MNVFRNLDKVGDNSRHNDVFYLLYICRRNRISDTPFFYQNSITSMSHLKDQLTREIAGIILRYVRNEKGRLSEISRDSRINRREFTIRGLAKMKLHRLLRILYDLCLELPYAEYMKMTDEIRQTISDYANEYDYTLLDEW